jgi:two-component system chemotaxis sensor kinase CheA
LLFRVEHQIYAVALNAVAEIARARQSEVHQVSHYEVLQLRDQVLPLIRLGHSLQDARRAGKEDKIFVLVIAVGGRKIGLIVDGMEGEEELVIKTLDDHAIATDLVSGASILGDGRVVLIVNVAAILERFLRSGREAEPGAISGLLLSSPARLGPSAEVHP